MPYQVERASQCGAVAVILINNDTENPDAVVTLSAPEGYTALMPAMMVSQSDGARLLELHNNRQAAVSFVSNT